MYIFVHVCTCLTMRKNIFSAGSKILEYHSLVKIKAFQLHTYEFVFGITILKLLLTFSEDPARTRSFL